MRKIFNLISFVMLLWTIISGIYLALPVEYKELIPEFNWLTALVSGGSTGVLGGSILIIDKYLKKNQADVDTKYLDLATKFLSIYDKYIVLENKVEASINIQNNTNELLEKTNRLISIDLQSKLSNPLVENFIKERIRGEGIGEEQPEEEETSI